MGANNQYFLIMWKTTGGCADSVWCMMLTEAVIYWKHEPNTRIQSPGCFLNIISQDFRARTNCSSHEEG